MNNNNIICVKNLNKRFKQRVIFENFSCSIQQNTINTIFGPSGSGKSTLLNILGLLENYDSGSIQLFNSEAPKINSNNAMMIRRKNISYLFQNFGLIEDSTLKNNLKIGLQYANVSKNLWQEKMQTALKEVGLQDLPLNSHIYNLSGGEKQRVAMARILLKPAEIVLADEPTGSLDDKNKAYIINRLLYLKELGKTIIIVTHDSDFKDISDNIIKLK